MRYHKDVSFKYFRVLPNCRNTKGRPPLHKMKRYEQHEPWSSPPHSRGGAVSCTLLKDGEVFATGVSICSMADNFNYRVGREIAYGRALAEAKRKLKEGEECRSREPSKASYKGVNLAELPEGRYELDGYCIRLEQRGGGYTLHPEVRAGAEARV